MVELKCPKCGKVYQRGGFYYEKHVQSCKGEKPPKKTKITKTKLEKVETSTNILKRLDSIEYRLSKLEQEFKRFNSGKAIKTEIPNEDQFLAIINQKVLELSQKMLGIQKVRLKDLYLEVLKDYNISKNEFSGYLLKLNHNNKVQLEPGMSADDFFIKDNYGNVFKLIRILD